jgi:hypothetical protein
VVTRDALGLPFFPLLAPPTPFRWLVAANPVSYGVTIVFAVATFIVVVAVASVRRRGTM